MAKPRLALITDRETAADRALSEARGVLEHWPGDALLPEVRVLALDELNGESDALEAVQTAWVRLDAQEPDEALYDALEVLEEHHVPTLLTRRGESQALGSEFADGVVVCPPHTPEATVYAMLRSLWSQGSSVRQLDRQVRLLEAQQGNLSGQMDQIDEELRLAAELQREFLPQAMPELARVALSVFWRPAGYVSGDIYDVMRLDEHRVGLFIADVVGHGVPAALMTMYIKRSLLTKQVDAALPGGYRIVEPSETLAQLNRDLLQRNARHVRFTTACYAVLDARFGSLTVARAGHPHPLLLRGGGATEALDPEGPLLGVFEEEAFEQKRYQLEPGDRLLMYSDGFEMAFGGQADPQTQQRRVASDQYEHEFEALREGPLHEALDRFAQRLDTQAGSLNQRDDLTVLCAQMSEPMHLPQRGAQQAQPQDDQHGFSRLGSGV